MKRPGDKTPEPVGGRAAERLRMFEEARRPQSDAPEQKRSPEKGLRQRRPAKKGATPNEKQSRRRD